MTAIIIKQTPAVYPTTAAVVDMGAGDNGEFKFVVNGYDGRGIIVNVDVRLCFTLDKHNVASIIC